MRKLFYMGLEPYNSRYTLQLRQWNEEVFNEKNIDYTIVPGETLSNDQQIVTGSVLDAHGRSYYSMTQVAELVKLMQAGEVTNEDVVFFEDMFTPGIESLPYILCQTPEEFHPKIYVRCWAQSPDPDDFINRTGMLDWMRHYELMLDQFISGIFIASEELAAYMRVSGIKAPLYVVGLPFGKSEVQSRVPTKPHLSKRKHRIAFASRWDDEKQPDFYMDLAEKFAEIDPNLEFAIFTGRDYLDSNRPAYVERARALEARVDVNFKVHTNLKKDEYYALLADTKILFNCALQDWVSFTCIEADAMGTIPLYPAYRSFPETLYNREKHLYIPWSQESAKDKILQILEDCKHDGNYQHNYMEGYVQGKVVKYHNDTIARELEVMQGNGKAYARNDLDYRLHVATDKSKG